MIEFRPHHFLCSVGYQGRGYSRGFVVNFDRIVQQIRKDDETKIKVVFKLDNICSRCPHQILSKNTCADEKAVKQLDFAHASILNLYDQEIISFREAKQRIRKQMSLELFREACKPCEWQKLGICEEALKKLLA